MEFSFESPFVKPLWFQTQGVKRLCQNSKFSAKGVKCNSLAHRARLRVVRGSKR